MSIDLSSRVAEIDTERVCTPDAIGRRVIEHINNFHALNVSVQ